MLLLENGKSNSWNGSKVEDRRRALNAEGAKVSKKGPRIMDIWN